MADIKQAAIWMYEGKAVRRHNWPDGEFAIYTEMSPTQMAYVVTKPKALVGADPAYKELRMRLESVLAEDWEIADEHD